MIRDDKAAAAIKELKALKMHLLIDIDKIKKSTYSKKEKDLKLKKLYSRADAIELGIKSLLERPIFDYYSGRTTNYSTKENILDDAEDIASQNNGFISLNDIKLILDTYIKD